MVDENVSHCIKYESGNWDNSRCSNLEVIDSECLNGPTYLHYFSNQRMINQMGTREGFRKMWQLTVVVGLVDWHDICSGINQVESLFTICSWHIRWQTIFCAVLEESWDFPILKEGEKGLEKVHGYQTLICKAFLCNHNQDQTKSLELLNADTEDREFGCYYTITYHFNRFRF